MFGIKLQPSTKDRYIELRDKIKAMNVPEKEELERKYRFNEKIRTAYEIRTGMHYLYNNINNREKFDYVYDAVVGLVNKYPTMQEGTDKTNYFTHNIKGAFYCFEEQQIKYVHPDLSLHVNIVKGQDFVNKIINSEFDFSPKVIEKCLMTGYNDSITKGAAFELFLDISRKTGTQSSENDILYNIFCNICGGKEKVDEMIQKLFNFFFRNVDEHSNDPEIRDYVYCSLLAYYIAGASINQ